MFIKILFILSFSLYLTGIKNSILSSFAIAYEYPKIDIKNKSEYITDEVLKNGKQEMKKHKVIFLSIARDIENNILILTKSLETIGNLFDDYYIIIVEGDSKDNTKKMLDLWQSKNNKVKIIHKDFDRSRRRDNLEQDGLEFLAKIRNIYLAEYNKPKYDKFDIAIILDSDLKFQFNEIGVIHSFANIGKWDMVAANGIVENQKYRMIDPFSFRKKGFPDPIDFKTVKKYNLATYSTYSVDGIKLIPSNNFIEVDSAFNWLAIYKKKFIKNCWYSSKPRGCFVNGDCEHIAFNNCIKQKNNGRLFMNLGMPLFY